MKKTQRGGKRAGAGRKQIYAEGPTIVVAASVPSGLVHRLNTVAEQNGWNRSATITEAIRELLRQQERKSGASKPFVGTVATEQLEQH